MEIKMDVNAFVKVKLTDFGVAVLKAKHEKDKVWCYQNGIKVTEIDFTLELDEDGYYTQPLWKLMNVFAEYVHPNEKTVFESELIVLDSTSVSK